MLKCKGYTIEQKTPDTAHILTEYSGIRYWTLVRPSDVAGKRMLDGVDPLTELCSSVTKRAKQKLEHHVSMCRYFGATPILGDFYESNGSRCGDKVYFGITVSILDHPDLWKTIDKETTPEQYTEYTYYTKPQKELFAFGE
jgi:hypothetical protein